MAEESFDPLTPSRPRPAGPGDADTESIKREIEQTRVVMSETIGEIQERLREHVFAGGIRLHTRIGINTGSVIGGTVGHADRLSYTLLGDAVNTASRLQEMNKQHGTRILVSATTLQLAGQYHNLLRMWSDV